MSRFVLASGLLSGTIIGAGIFSLPYIVRQVGFVPAIIYFLVFGGVYTLIHLMYAKVVAIQEGDHQFLYLARKYFRTPFSYFSSSIIVAELVFVLTVYLVLVPTFSEVAFQGFGIPSYTAFILFWLLGSLFMFVKLDWLGVAEILGTVSVVGIIALLFFSAWGKPFAIPAFEPLTLPLFFLPFGPLLFSLAGRPAIPEVVQEYKKSIIEGKTFSLKKSILWGTLIPVAVYFLFVVSVLKLNPNVSAETLNSLTLSPLLLSLLGVMGLITLWTSYFIIGINVKDILRDDLKISGWISGSAAVFLPLILYLVGFRNFLDVLSFTGGVFLGLEAVFVIALWRKAFPDHAWRKASMLLYAPFLIAIIYEIAKFVI